MTDEELAAIRERWNGISQQEHISLLMLPSTQVRRDVGALLAEVERLRAYDRLMHLGHMPTEDIDKLRSENDALREIVQAVADRSWYTHSSTLGGDWQQYACCPFAECEQESREGSRGIQHTPDCPVTKARALLGTEGE